MVVYKGNSSQCAQMTTKTMIMTHVTYANPISKIEVLSNHNIGTSVITSDTSYNKETDYFDTSCVRCAVPQAM
jgi:hypothetical protein